MEHHFSTRELREETVSELNEAIVNRHRGPAAAYKSAQGDATST